MTTTKAKPRVKRLLGDVLRAPATNEIVHALSICDPWAWLVVSGRKTLENRTWKSAYRGRIAIHTSTSVDHFRPETLESLEASPEVDDAIHEGSHDIGNQRPLFLPGCIVGSVEFFACLEYDQGDEFPAPGPSGDAFYGFFDDVLGKPLGDVPHDIYADGPYCFCFRSAKRYLRPILAPGRLNLWNLSAQQRAAVAAAENEKPLDDLGAPAIPPKGYDFKRFRKLL